MSTLIIVHTPPSVKVQANATITRFPYQIGYDASGVVVDIGDDVKGLKVGDEVYTRLPEISRGNTECHWRLACDDDEQDNDERELTYSYRLMERVCQVCRALRFSEAQESLL